MLFFKEMILYFLFIFLNQGFKFFHSGCILFGEFVNLVLNLLVDPLLIDTTSTLLLLFLILAFQRNTLFLFQRNRGWAVAIEVLRRLTANSIKLNIFQLSSHRLTAASQVYQIFIHLLFTPFVWLL